MSSESSDLGVTLIPMRIEWREGDVIRKLRDVAGWGLEQLAEISGVDLQTIHRIEKGYTKEPKARTLYRIAQAFGITERQLRDAIPPAMDLSVRFSSAPEPKAVEPFVRSDVLAFLASLDAGTVEDKQIARDFRAVYAKRIRVARPPRRRRASGK